MNGNVVSKLMRERQGLIPDEAQSLEILLLSLKMDSYWTKRHWSRFLSKFLRFSPADNDSTIATYLSIIHCHPV
jgi:hypothetical protein